jgi:hypothetical protein
MRTAWRFLVKFSSLIVGTLHCFDRVIFKGHLVMAAPSELERFVDDVLRVRRCHFIKALAPRWSDRLIEHGQRFAKKHGRTYLYRTSSFKKDRARLDRASTTPGMDHADIVRDDDGRRVQIAEEHVPPKPLQLMGVAGNCRPLIAGEEKRPLPDSNRGWRICNPLP